MENKDIIQKLINLQSIKPDAAFLAHSRNLIFTEKQKFSPTYTLREYFNKPIFVAVSLCMVFVIGTSVMFLSTRNTSLSSLQQTNNLQEEFQNLSINIQLKEISYSSDANEMITAAITEISDTKTRHLNQDILESEKNLIQPEGTSETKIDTMLDQVIF